MNNNIHVYCDMDFWKEFMEEFVRSAFYISIDDDEWKRVQCGRFLFRRLVSDIVLHLDCTKEELFNEIERESGSYDEPMRILENKLASRNGGNIESLDCSYDYGGSFPSINLNSVYCTNNQQVRKNIENKGILVISIRDLKTARYCLEQAIVVKGGEKNDWQQLLQPAIHVCNSLIICDSYIFSRDLGNNLYRILDVLISHKISEKFQLTIFTLADDKKQLEKWRNDLSCYLTEHNENHIEISIVRVDRGQQHDRRIISNNVYIECPGGFDLIKRNGTSSKDTTIWISFPKFGNPRDANSYFDIIKDSRRKIQNNLVVPSNVENRLIM